MLAAYVLFLLHFFAIATAHEGHCLYCCDCTTNTNPCIQGCTKVIPTNLPVVTVDATKTIYQECTTCQNTSTVTVSGTKTIFTPCSTCTSNTTSYVTVNATSTVFCPNCQQTCPTTCRTCPTSTQTVYVSPSITLVKTVYYTLPPVCIPYPDCTTTKLCPICPPITIPTHSGFKPTTTSICNYCNPPTSVVIFPVCPCTTVTTTAYTTSGTSTWSSIQTLTIPMNTMTVTVTGAAPTASSSAANVNYATGAVGSWSLQLTNSYYTDSSTTYSITPTCKTYIALNNTLSEVFSTTAMITATGSDVCAAPTTIIVCPRNSTNCTDVVPSAKATSVMQSLGTCILQSNNNTEQGVNNTNTLESAAASSQYSQWLAYLAAIAGILGVAI